MKLKLTKIGNSVGMILPKETLTRMKVGQGDQVWLTEVPDGYHVTPYDPDFGEQMVAARKIMKKRRGALRELAK